MGNARQRNMSLLEAGVHHVTFTHRCNDRFNLSWEDIGDCSGDADTIQSGIDLHVTESGSINVQFNGSTIGVINGTHGECTNEGKDAFLDGVMIAPVFDLAREGHEVTLSVTVPGSGVPIIRAWKGVVD